MTYGNVCITGGAGFLGSQLVKKMLPLCERIFVIDNLSTGKKEALPVSDKLTFYQDCITNEALLEEVLPQVDYIFHLACSNLYVSVEKQDIDFQTNAYGGYVLLKKAHQCCPSLKRFVYASTVSVYGNAEERPTLESYYRIQLPYAASKFATEHYGQVYHAMYDLPVTTLRFSNVYGPGQNPSNPYCGVVAKFFEAVVQHRPMTIYGDGNQTRDFTFIEDSLNALLAASREMRAIGQVYNVGTGKETSVLQLAREIYDIAGYTKYPLRFLPKRKVDVVRRRVVDPSKIQQDMNWEARDSLRQGLVKTWAWIKEGAHAENLPRVD